MLSQLHEGFVKRACETGHTAKEAEAMFRWALAMRACFDPLFLQGFEEAAEKRAQEPTPWATMKRLGGEMLGAGKQMLAGPPKAPAPPVPPAASGATDAPAAGGTTNAPAELPEDALYPKDSPVGSAGYFYHNPDPKLRDAYDLLRKHNTALGRKTEPFSLTPGPKDTPDQIRNRLMFSNGDTNAMTLLAKRQFIAENAAKGVTRDFDQTVNPPPPPHYTPPKPTVKTLSSEALAALSPAERVNYPIWIGLQQRFGDVVPLAAYAAFTPKQKAEYKLNLETNQGAVYGGRPSDPAFKPGDAKIPDAWKSTLTP